MLLLSGFKAEKHVVSNAPKLFSDVFYIQTILQMSKFGVTSHGANFTISAREDIRTMYKEFLDDATHINNKVVNCMQEKGIYIRMPSMNYPTEVDFINKDSIFTGWFGRRRPLLGIEVTHLVTNGIQNDMGNIICTGFSQVTQDKEIQNYFQRGKQLCKHISTSIYDVLEENDVPVGMSWDQSITKSTVAPFSDQFMLNVIGVLSSLGITGYAAGLSTTLRRDISAMYASFITKTGAYVEDGMNIMIDREWMEQPPKIVER